MMPWTWWQSTAAEDHGALATGLFASLVWNPDDANGLFHGNAVQTEVIVDVYKPVDGWKKEPHSTVGIVAGKQIIFEYAMPGDVPQLMDSWFALYSQLDVAIQPGNARQALDAFVLLHTAFVRIHPFFDGNGRMARLVANLPVLKAGLPPIIIPREQRKEYIDLLSAYHFAVGQIQADDVLLPDQDKLRPFTEFCQLAWRESISLVEDAREKQQKRGGGRK